jgi:hypothetical protein
VILCPRCGTGPIVPNVPEEFPGLVLEWSVACGCGALWVVRYEETPSEMRWCAGAPRPSVVVISYPDGHGGFRDDSDAFVVNPSDDGFGQSIWTGFRLITESERGGLDVEAWVDARPAAEVLGS